MAHKNYYAHLSNNRRELLIGHLTETGKLAEKSAFVFGCGKLGLQLGLLHDVGKHTDRFQKVLRHELKKIDHAIVAAECYAELASQDILDSIASNHLLIPLAKSDFLNVDGIAVTAHMDTTNVPSLRRKINAM